MKLFGKKKVEKQEAFLEKVMAEAMGKALAEKLMGEIKSDIKQVEDALPVKKKEVFEESYFTKTDNTSFIPDDITPTNTPDDITPIKMKVYTRDGVHFTDYPNGGTETTLPIGDDMSVSNVKNQKRKYTKRNKEFWGSKKTAQQEPKEDTLRVFRQRSAASAISPDDFAKLAREGDVYYIPYTDDKPYGFQQSQYTGRVCNRLKTRCSTIYGVNGTTHKAENLMKIELLKK